jgi:lipoprotein-anchoring transpeptidase ErfK/SrfK
MLLMLAFVLLGAVLMLILAGRDSRADAVRSALGMVTETPTATATLLPTETPTRLPTLTASPTLAAPAITATVAITLTPVLTTTLPFNPTPSWVTARYAPLPLEEKWIEVNLTTQTLIAYEGTKVVFKTKISSGRKNTPTLEGKWRIREKLESQLMSGPGYYLPGVPYVMYFVGSYALHGAYWHNNWGTPMSHGCVNLKREDARWLYGWTGPVVPKGAKSVVSTAANPGTWVLVHK